MSEDTATKRSAEELIEAARSGQPGALEKLLRSQQARILRFSSKMCGHPEDAEDVLQETLLAMARSVGDFRGASSISTWLYTIARSFCTKKRRKSKFAPRTEESVESSVAHDVRQLRDPAVGPEQHVQHRQTAKALEQAIASLDPSQREVLLLRDMEGLSAAEVAEVLKIGVPAVKSRLHRARAAVRAHLSPLLAPEDERVPAQPAMAPPAAGERCPDVVDLLSRNLEGELSQKLCAEMQSHVNRCGHCQARCDSLKQTLALCAAVPEPRVPDHLQDSVRQAVDAYLAEAHKPASGKRPV